MAFCNIPTRSLLGLVGLAMLLINAPAWAQEKSPTEDAAAATQIESSQANVSPSPQPNTSFPANEKIFYWQVGVTVVPKTWPVRGGVVRIPVPNDWPEQRVLLYSVDPEEGLTYEQKTIEGGLNILEVSIPHIAKGDKAELLITYQVVLTPIPLPDQARYFKRPEKPDRTVVPYLASSPLIDPKHPSIKKLVAEVTDGVADDWPRVEKMYDWVLANITLSADEPAGAVKALANKKGNREDRINLFVAMCRCFKIPARTVWSNGMEYAEFYLLDGLGNGQWIPCSLSGAREFGSHANLAVIEQKGESFKLPGSNERRRFVNATASIATERNARGEPERPTINFVRRPMSQPPSPK